MDEGWTAEREERLTRLWGKGVSGGSIAKELGISKNAAIGKVHRLGLEKRRTVTRKAGPGRPRHSAPSPLVPRLIEGVSCGPPLEPTLEPPPQPGPVSLFDLRANSCRWPLGATEDVATLFCGDATVAKASYCPRHCAIAYNAPAPRSQQYKRWREPGGGRWS